MNESLYKTLRPQLDLLEHQRQNALAFKKPYNFYSLIALIVAAGFLLSLYLTQTFHFVWLIAVLILTFIVIGILQSKGLKKLNDYKDDFHAQIVQAIVSTYDPSLLYNKSEHISRSEFVKSNLFTRKPNKIEGSNLIQGYYRKVSIKASYLDAVKEHVDGDGKKHEDQIFSGLFIVADTFQNWQGATYVLPDRTEKLIGRFANWFQKHFGRATLVTMDDPIFEKEFVVYSTHPEEAKMILNPGMMENIHYIRKSLHKPIYLKFDQSLLYIAITNLGKDLRIKHKEKANDREVFDRIHKEIHTWIDLIDELGLND